METFRDYSWYPEKMPKLPAPKHCRCCDQLVSAYRRRIHAGVAATAIRLWHIQKRSAPFDIYWHVRRFDTGASRGEFAKLRFWGLIRVRDPGARRCSEYRLTKDGVRYVCGALSVPRYCVLQTNQVLFYGGPAQPIQAALSDSFDYQELFEDDSWVEEVS